MSASHRRTVGIDATGTIAELANIPKRECAGGWARGSLGASVAVTG
jgi:hypothetical protein